MGNQSALEVRMQKHSTKPTAHGKRVFKLPLHAGKPGLLWVLECPWYNLDTPGGLSNMAD